MSTLVGASLPSKDLKGVQRALRSPAGQAEVSAGAAFGWLSKLWSPFGSP